MRLGGFSLSSCPGRCLYPLLGLALGVGAPLGLLVLRGFLEEGVTDIDWIRSELAAHRVTYLYLALSAPLVFALLGYVLGAQRDLLLQSSITDPLTGLFNRRHMEDRLREELARAARHGQPLAFLLIDLDGLKEINDRRGHEAGDAALQAVTESLRQSCRVTDIAARFGGDEFAVLAPLTSAPEALHASERIRAILKQQGSGKGKGVVSLSVSIGVTDNRQGSVMEPREIYRMADKALYEAKERGRDRAVYSGG